MDEDPNDFIAKYDREQEQRQLSSMSPLERRIYLANKSRKQQSRKAREEKLKKDTEASANTDLLMNRCKICGRMKFVCICGKKESWNKQKIYQPPKAVNLLIAHSILDVGAAIGMHSVPEEKDGSEIEQIRYVQQELDSAVQNLRQKEELALQKVILAERETTQMVEDDFNSRLRRLMDWLLEHELFEQKKALEVAFSVEINRTISMFQSRKEKIQEHYNKCVSELESVAFAKMELEKERSRSVHQYLKSCEQRKNSALSSIMRRLRVLGDSKRMPNTLSTFDGSHLGITDAQLLPILDALRERKGILHLNLSDNLIKQKGAYNFAIWLGLNEMQTIVQNKVEPKKRRGTKSSNVQSKRTMQPRNVPKIIPDSGRETGNRAESTLLVENKKLEVQTQNNQPKSYQTSVFSPNFGSIEPPALLDTVQTVILDDNQLGDGAYYLILALCAASNLEHLSLKNTGLSDICALAIKSILDPSFFNVALLQLQQLEQQKSASCPNSANLQHTAPLRPPKTPKNTQTPEMQCFSKKIDDDSAYSSFIAPTLQSPSGNLARERINSSVNKSPLRSLDLSKNRLSYETAAAIGVALQNNDTLADLCLEWNNISCLGAQELSIGLQTNRMLEVLRLGWNGIAREGCLAIAEALLYRATGEWMPNPKKLFSLLISGMPFDSPLLNSVSATPISTESGTKRQESSFSRTNSERPTPLDASVPTPSSTRRRAIKSPIVQMTPKQKTNVPLHMLIDLRHNNISSDQIAVSALGYVLKRLCGTILHAPHFDYHIELRQNQPRPHTTGSMESLLSINGKSHGSNQTLPNVRQRATAQPQAKRDIQRSQEQGNEAYVNSLSILLPSRPSTAADKAPGMGGVSQSINLPKSKNSAVSKIQPSTIKRSPSKFLRATPSNRALQFPKSNTKESMSSHSIRDSITQFRQDYGKSNTAETSSSEKYEDNYQKTISDNFMSTRALRRRSVSSSSLFVPKASMLPLEGVWEEPQIETRSPLQNQLAPVFTLGTDLNSNAQTDYGSRDTRKKHSILLNRASASDLKKLLLDVDQDGRNFVAGFDKPQPVLLRHPTWISQVIEDSNTDILLRWIDDGIHVDKEYEPRPNEKATEKLKLDTLLSEKGAITALEHNGLYVIL